MPPTRTGGDSLPSESTPANTGEQVLLVSKCASPPVRDDLVPRPRLTGRLQRGFHLPLTLVAAPAGFGKTTLLTTWLKQAPLPAAWLSLEQSDDDLTRFWSYVFLALERVQPGSGASAAALLQTSHLAPQPPIETVLAVWINGLASQPHEVALVLDDYHLLTAPAIHQTVAYLVDHLPPQLHLILSTRADPALPLARLRTRGQLMEIRAADLRFTGDEVVAFLTRMRGPNLSDEQIAVVETRTEGWIAGLQLAALSMQGRDDLPAFLAAFSGSHHYVIDYLVQEVLAKQPQEVQTFLLHTAILARLQESLCEAVLGETVRHVGGQTMLEQLEQANLFLTPLDEERRWYRYHPLFAEALRHQLQRTQRDRIPDLHQRASHWYEEHGFVLEAVQHALATADGERAGRLTVCAADLLVKRGELGTLRACLEALPADVVRTQVELGFWYGWLLIQTGQFDAAEQLLQELEEPLRRDTTSPDALAASHAGEPPPRTSTDPRSLGERSGRLAALRAYRAFRQGETSQTVTWARQALGLLHGDQTVRGLVAWFLSIAYLWHGEMTAAAASLVEARSSSQAAGHSHAAWMASFELAQLHVRQGHLHLADQSYAQALDVGAARDASLAAAGPMFVGRGDLQREWNLLDRATHSLLDGIAGCKQTGNAVMLLLGYITLVRVKQAQGDSAGADILLQDVERLLRTSYLPPHNQAQLTAWHVRVALAQGELAPAARWVQERQLCVEDDLSGPREFEYQVLARVLLAQHRPDEALPLLERLLQLAEREGRMGNAVELLVVQALARQACGHETLARERLARALAVAEPEGYLRLFVDEGAPMARLLMQLRRRGGSNQLSSLHYRDRLLALLAPATDEGSRPSAADVPGEFPFHETFSERELAVLRLIAAGCSNQEIADRLVLTLSTVKWYINTLYGKLQVDSRTRAIARARDLHLL